MYLSVQGSRFNGYLLRTLLTISIKIPNTRRTHSGETALKLDKNRIPNIYAIRGFSTLNVEP